MKRHILKLTLATLALGLWAAPATAQTPQQQQQMQLQMFIQAQRFGMWNRVNIFSQPRFQLVTDPRGANFGFTQQILWGPSMRSVFSPFGQTTLFRSDASSMLVWNPSMGPVARINTPAIFGFRTSANGAVQSFSRPSISVLSNVNGSAAFANPNVPTFLSGNINVSVPLNGTAAISIPSSSLSAALSPAAAASALNTTNNASATMSTAVTRGRAAANATAATSAQGRFMTIQEGLAQGFTLDQILHTPLSQQFGVKAANTGNSTGRFMTIEEGLAQGFTLDQILHTPMSQMFGVRAARRGGATNAMWWGPRGTQVPAGNFSGDNIPLARQAAAYSGYVPANQIIP